MEDQAVEDAMVVIQQASSAIAKVSTRMDSNNDSVLAVLKDLSNKISQLEKSTSQSNQPSSPQVKPPLYIRVS